MKREVIKYGVFACYAQCSSTLKGVFDTRKECAEYIKRYPQTKMEVKQITLYYE